MLVKPEDFQSLVAPLRTKNISHAWKGYGSAIFLELGNLVQSDGTPNGEACISLEWDWRIESDTEIVGGSSESGGAIAALVRSLIGLEISALQITSAPQELCVSLSDGKRVRSMAAVAGDPQWSIRLADRWLSSEAGTLTLGDGTSVRTMTAEECAVAAHAKETALRWERPMPTQLQGACRNCRSFIHLDGNYDLLDFGVCTNAKSPMDGRVAALEFGCSAFVGE